MTKDENQPVHHSKDHLPTPVLNNEQDPDSFGDPLEEELQKVEAAKQRNEEKKRVDQDGE